MKTTHAEKPKQNIASGDDEKAGVGEVDFGRSKKEKAEHKVH